MDINALGINNGKVKQFNSKGIFTIEDLISFLPRKYYDFRTPTLVKNTVDGEFCSIIGTIESVTSGNGHIKVKIKDELNWSMNIIWFNQDYVQQLVKEGDTYNFCGKVEFNEVYKSRQMVNPMSFSKDLNRYKKIVPVYSKIQGMGEDYLLRSINTALALVEKDEYLDVDIMDRFNLYGRKNTINSIHQPKELSDVEMAKSRLVFDDLFFFSTQLSVKGEGTGGNTDIIMSKANTVNPFIKSLGYSLTDDQLTTVRGIYKDMRSGRSVNALVQGDVGSGKTIVAFLLMLIAAENGYQSALMCPTSVLAYQHYAELKKIGDSFGYQVAYLTSSTKAKEKREILAGLASGDILMVVGTHAIISKGVAFNSLGLTVVDEEHRFGVVQRELINEKTKGKVHSVTMSATPIPRSLALTVYGDNATVYNIIQMPSGRKPIITELLKNDSAAYNQIHEEIKKGRQCYVVCPLIDESEADVMQGVFSVNEVHRDMMSYFLDTDISIDVISGNMKQSVIEDKIERFSKGNTDILISTTIIEVGVNVPNASVMLIQNAERFGLAQLHQLRGRVGRGIHQSHCIMLSQLEDSEKLQAMVDTTSGFKIAEVDLRLRGAGDFIGTKQSGDNKYIMLMLSFPALFNSIREETKKIMGDEVLLKYYEDYIDSVRESLEKMEA